MTSALSIASGNDKEDKGEQGKPREESVYEVQLQASASKLDVYVPYSEGTEGEDEEQTEGSNSTTPAIYYGQLAHQDESTEEIEDGDVQGQRNMEWS